MRSRLWVAPVVAVAVAGAVGGLATPAHADTRQAEATPVAFAECADGDEWVFQISGVGTGTGIAAPENVTVALADGSEEVFPLDHVTGDTDTWLAHSAFYAKAVSQPPTGAATAHIDDAWKPDENHFELVFGPCEETDITIAAEPETIVMGEVVTVSGALTQADGIPLPARKVTPMVTLPNPPTKGGTQFLGEVETDEDGRFQASIEVNEPGPLTFGARYEGVSAVEETPREERSVATTIVWSFPPDAPQSEDGLVSDGGTTVEAGSEVTVSSSGSCGCGVNLDVVLLAYSTPTVLGNTTTDDRGEFRATVAIPEDLSGEHTLVAMVVPQDPDDQVRYLTLPIEVASDAEGQGGSLPVTGGSTLAIAGAGGVLTLLGVAVWLGTRRRTVRFTAG